MATRTKPLVTAAALASAAAIAVAGTAITPSLNLPTPHALSAAKIQLATLTDVLSIPAVEWTNVLFSNTDWGGRLSADSYGADWAEPQNLIPPQDPDDPGYWPGYVNPWAYGCDGGCGSSGPSGVAYMFFDALVNGDGLGYNQRDDWSVGLVNYLFEPFYVGFLGNGLPTIQYVTEGWSAASWYILQGTIGQAFPELTKPIAAAYWGPTNVSVFYDLGLTITAGLVRQVPAVGPFIGNSILAYIGDLPVPGSPDVNYQPGLSGPLNYWIDIATGSAPFPSASTKAGAGAALVAAATPAAASSESPAADVKASIPAGDAPESTPAEDAPVSTPAGDVAESTPADDALESTPAVTETKPVDVPEISVPEVKDTTTIDDVVDSTPAPAKSAPKRPVRDAVEKVTKQITSAINGSRAAKAGAAKASKADNAR